MKNSNVTGWKDVFGFTYLQTMKSRSNIITTIIFVVIAIATIPVMSLLNGTDTVKPSRISKVLILNNTDIEMTESLEKVMGGIEQYKGIDYEAVKEEQETVQKEMKEADDDTQVLLILNYNNETGFAADFKYTKDSTGFTDDVDEYSDDLTRNFQMIMAGALDIDRNKLDAVNMEVVTSVDNYTDEDINNAFDEQEDEEMDLNQYSVILFLITVVIFLVAVSGESVAGAIITEKSSKIVEFLLTSIRPMAIIIGKVLAQFMVTLTVMAIFIAGFGISFLINGYINESFSVDALPSNIQPILNGDALKGLNVINIVISFVVLIMGILFYCVLAGLVGSTVSKIEEMAEGMKLYTFTMLVGSYVGIIIAIICIVGKCPEIVKIVASIFPITAPFCLPGFILIGDLALIPAIISIICMVTSLLLLTKFTANVYEEVIYHNGDRLKVRDVIGIYKKNRREA